MKQLLLATLLFIFCWSACNKVDPDYEKLIGFWGVEIQDASNTQQFVVHFNKVDNDITCQFHSYFNGIKSGSERGADIDFDGNAISFIANQNANVRYEGKIDTTQGIIFGRLIYADGSGREFNLEKIPEEKLAVEYKGLYNFATNNDGLPAPEQTEDGWKVGSITESGIDSLLLQDMVEAIHNGKFGKLHSVLIAKNGKLVWEKYFDGFYIDDLNSLESCTKSIGSILIGIAIDEGFIENVDQAVLDFFPSYKEELNQEWNNLELKHLLTMSTGLNWDRDLHDGIYGISGDVIETTFQQKFSQEPGKVFEYRNPQTDLLSGIIINSSKMSPQDFADRYLFTPLNIDDFNWQNFKSTNYPLMSGSLALSSRNMLKIGQLVLDKGKWNGQQVVSEDWIHESTSFKIQTDQTFGYGYLWWIAESTIEPHLQAVFAMGISGQFIVIIPEGNLVVVTTAANMNKEPEIILNMIDEYIIKGLM